MNTTKIAVLLTVLAGCLFAGCSMDRWTKVEPGEYTPVRGIGTASKAAAQEIQKVEIDRDKDTVTFTLVDGSQIVASFVPRDRASWPSGCPSNVGSTYMEVLDIAKNTLTIDAATFHNPILVRDCPPDPVHVALRENGRIGGGGGACMGANECILFDVSKQ
jgi:hypothetical protein